MERDKIGRTEKEEEEKKEVFPMFGRDRNKLDLSRIADMIRIF